MNARESDWNGKSRQTCASCNSLQVETIPFLFRRNNNSHQRQLHLVHNDTTVLLSLWIESTLGATISPSSSPLVPSPNGYGCASKWSGERPVIAPAPSTSLPFYLFLCWARLTLRHSWRQPDRLIRHSQPVGNKSQKRALGIKQLYRDADMRTWLALFEKYPPPFERVDT